MGHLKAISVICACAAAALILVYFIMPAGKSAAEGIFEDYGLSVTDFSESYGQEHVTAFLAGYSDDMTASWYMYDTAKNAKEAFDTQADNGKAFYEAYGEYEKEERRNEIEFVSDGAGGRIYKRTGKSVLVVEFEAETQENAKEIAGEF